MRLDKIILELRKNLPIKIFGERVFGLADLDKTEKEKDFSNVPSVFVVYGGDTAEEQPEDQNFISQDVTETVHIVVVIDATNGNRGNLAQLKIHSYRALLWKTLLGKDFDESGAYLEYNGSSEIFIDPSVYIHDFKFTQTSEIKIGDINIPEYSQLEKIWGDWDIKNKKSETNIDNLYMTND
jgi:hypothetical protein